MGRTAWQILRDASGDPEYMELSYSASTSPGQPLGGVFGWSALSREETPTPRYWTFEQRTRHKGNAVRTFPVEIDRRLILVALRASHGLDHAKLARALEVDPDQVKPALPIRVRRRLGFEPGFETLVTDENVPRLLDIRVTWMRAATITTGSPQITVDVAPEMLLSVTGATIGDFAAEPAPLDAPETLPYLLSPSFLGGTELSLREVAKRVDFPLWIPGNLPTGFDRCELWGANWSAGLGSPVTGLDRALLTFEFEPGGWSVHLDESPSRVHHQRARQEWPRLIEPGLDQPGLTRLDFVERDGVGITLVTGERFPGDLQEIADSLVKFEIR